MHEDQARDGKVVADVAGATATLTLDSPRRRNALTATMRGQLLEHLQSLRARPEIRVVILTGRGDDFSAGMDITELTPESLDEVGGQMVSLEEAISTFPVPVIASIRGNCIGAAAQLAVACDVRVADPNARFAITPAKLGLVYPAESLARLVSVIGATAAEYLLLSAEVIDAASASRFGLTTEIAADLDARVTELAGNVCSRSPTSVRAAKAAFSALLSNPTQRAEAAAASGKYSQHHAAIGLEAFQQRQSPNFPDFSNADV